MVPEAGIEPARLAAGDFESPASTNFTTRAGSARQSVAPGRGPSLYGVFRFPLADRLGLSPRQLQRLFRQHLDTTPQAYARVVRLRQAAWMLRHTDKAIAAIASDCGFADAAHMGRAFRAAHGMAPGAWRRTGREGVDESGGGPAPAGLGETENAV